MRHKNTPSTNWENSKWLKKFILLLAEAETLFESWKEKQNEAVELNKMKDKLESSNLVNKVRRWNKSGGGTDQTFSGPIYFTNVGDIISFLN